MSLKEHFETWVPDGFGDIVPAQFFERVGRISDTPEGGLLVAIFFRALLDLKKGKRADREDARRWFEEEDGAFETLCEALGIAADAARRRILSGQARPDRRHALAHLGDKLQADASSLLSKPAGDC